MKIKGGFVLKAIADSYMVVPLGSYVKEFNSIIKLNESGAFLWSQLESEKNENELIDAMLSEYDIDEITAKNALDSFLSKLKENDLLENYI